MTFISLNPHVRGKNQSGGSQVDDGSRVNNTLPGLGSL